MQSYTHTRTFTQTRALHGRPQADRWGSSSWPQPRDRAVLGKERAQLAAEACPRVPLGMSPPPGRSPLAGRGVGDGEPWSKGGAAVPTPGPSLPPSQPGRQALRFLPWWCQAWLTTAGGCRRPGKHPGVWVLSARPASLLGKQPAQQLGSHLARHYSNAVLGSCEEKREERATAGIRFHADRVSQKNV